MTHISLNASVAASADTVTQHRIVDAAQKFEAILLGEMLKPLREKSELAPKEEDSTDNSTYSSYGMEALAQSMVRAGGIGIASQIVQHLSQAELKNSREK